MKSKYTLNYAMVKTKKVADKIKNKNWTIHTRFVELIEEVGELANAIQTDEGFKTKKKKKSDVTNSVCDILFNILMIADHYSIDLDKEYPEVLDEIDERNRNGDFDQE